MHMGRKHTCSNPWAGLQTCCCSLTCTKTLLLQLQNYERKNPPRSAFTLQATYGGKITFGKSPGLPALEYWDKLVASGFIPLLRNIPASSVINNLGLVFRAGVGHGFVSFEESGWRFFYIINCQSTTLHISCFAVPHSVLSLEMQHDTSNFSVIQSMSGCRQFARTLIIGCPLPPPKNHLTKWKPLQSSVTQHLPQRIVPFAM